MKIYSSREEARKIQEKRDAYVARYNKKKAAYDAQMNEYTARSSEFQSAMVTEIKSSLSPEINAFPNIEIIVNPLLSRARYGCSITIKNLSAKHIPDRWGTIPQARGLSWSYYISWVHANDISSGVTNSPRIVANILQADDYPVLLATYNLFNKIQQINWSDLLERIYTEMPARAELVTVEDPGELDTSRYDKQLKNNTLDAFVGKDIWVKIKYKKTGNSYPETYYVKLLKSKGGYYDAVKLGGYSDLPKRMTRAEYIRHMEPNGPSRFSYYSWRIELRKNGIELIEPIETLTTDEIFDIVDE